MHKYRVMISRLWVTDLDQISQLTRLSKRVVQQYIDLLPEKVLKKLTKNENLKK